MEISGNENKQKVFKKYYCEKCHYDTDRKSNFDNHLLSFKHMNMINGNCDSCEYMCDKCDKTYNTYSGLWKHKKQCGKPHISTNQPNSDLMMILIKQNTELIKENKEFKNVLLEIVKKDTNTTNNITNSHNKTFNLHFFLNETCKDAMNITDFVDSIKLQLSDLENVGKKGFIQGISNIIVENLHSLDETKRPVHCTDAKREVMYIKNEDKWEKEEENKQKIRKVIKRVAQKNTLLLNEYKTKYPDCVKSDSIYSDHYSNLVIESMGGIGENDFEKETKIIKNIAKEVTIEK